MPTDTERSPGKSGPQYDVAAYESLAVVVLEFRVVFGSVRKDKGPVAAASKK